LEKIVNDFDGKENLCRCEVGLTKTTRKRSIDLKNWMRFTHTLKSMHNDINRDKVWKNRMIALNDMPLMTTKELHIYFSYS
jgi:hypothetical protein